MDIDKHLKKESKKFKLDRTKSAEQQARLKKKKKKKSQYVVCKDQIDH